MVLVGAKQLESNRAKVDALNVFPVPDGDTGTNMSLTMQSAVKELNSTAASDFPVVCDCISKGALRGARGNSGVILSQIFRGICSVLHNVKAEVDTKTFAKALEAGTKVAYGAVSIPKEGTILTVVRMMSEFAVKNAGKNREFEAFLPAVIKEGDRALAMTPDLLPVLKKAGVVDSGGVGLMTIMRGFLAALTGDEVVTELPGESDQQAQDTEFGDNSDIINMDLGDIQYAYCTEFFIINLKKSTTLADIDRLREDLMGLGDSVICIGDLEMVKVHVHTNRPGVALTYALELGELDRPKIENMLEQNRALKAKIEAEKKDQGMLAVCAGGGLSDIFKDLFVRRSRDRRRTDDEPFGFRYCHGGAENQRRQRFCLPEQQKYHFGGGTGESACRKPHHSRYSHEKRAAGVCGGACVQSRRECGREQNEYDSRARQYPRRAGNACRPYDQSKRFFDQRGRYYRVGRQKDPRQERERRRGGAQTAR